MDRLLRTHGRWLRELAAMDPHAHIVLLLPGSALRPTPAAVETRLGAALNLTLVGWCARKRGALLVEGTGFGCSGCSGAFAGSDRRTRFFTRAFTPSDWNRRRCTSPLPCQIRVRAAAVPAATPAARARYTRTVRRHGWRNSGAREFGLLAAWALHDAYDAVVVVAPMVRALVAERPAERLFRCVVEGWDVLATVGVFEPLDAGVLALRPDGAKLT